MLEIHYIQKGGAAKVATFDKASDFVSAEYLEVPPFDDADRVVRAVLDGTEVHLDDPTIGGLFRVLSDRS